MWEWLIFHNFSFANYKCVGMVNVNDLDEEKYTTLGMVLVLTELDVADIWSSFIPNKIPVHLCTGIMC